VSNKYFIHLSGGLGDHLLSYFGGKKIRRGPCGGFGFLEQLKKEQPDSKIKLIAHPTQMGTIKHFFKFHPHISEIKEYKWCNPCHKCKNEDQESQGYIKLDNYGVKKKWKRHPNHKIFTSKEDQIEINNITKEGSFILVHPFAGEKYRMPIEIENYNNLINRLVDEFNCNLVVVGATHKRETARIQNIQEDFKSNNKKVFNLVNKSNMRISAKLTQLAKANVVTHSVMFCAASHGLVPTLIVSNFMNHVRQRINVSYINKEKVDILPINKKPLTQIEMELTKCLHKLISA